MSKNRPQTTPVVEPETPAVSEPTVTSKQSKPNQILMDKVDIPSLYEEHKTHSAVIRKLNAMGYSRSDISKALGKIYQHVRNVLEQDALRAQSKNQK